MALINTTAGAGRALRAVLWDQGECEGGLGTAQATYQTAMEGLADSIATDLGVPIIASPVSLKTGDIGSCPAASANYIAIHNATDAAIASHHNLIGTVNKDDLQHITGDCSHVYDVQTLGERWFDAVQAEGLAY